MQLYRGMDIGTAKVPVDERHGIPHHLLDVLDLTEEASVADYQRDARAAIEAIQARGSLPILVGGSGLYVSSVIHDFAFPGTDAPSSRAAASANSPSLGPASCIAGYTRSTRWRPTASVPAQRPSARARPRGDRAHRRTVRRRLALRTDHPGGEALIIRVAHRPRGACVARLDARGAAGCGSAACSTRCAPCVRTASAVTAQRAIGYAQALAQLRW